MKRRGARKEGVRIAANLLELATRTASTDPELAKRQARLARKVMLKFNIRFDWSLRRFYCHGCKRLLLPGLNARVRLGSDKVIRMTCSECGYINRKLLRKARLNIQG